MAKDENEPSESQKVGPKDENTNAAVALPAGNRIGNDSREPESVVGNPRDILCGRGLHILNHHGNLQLHLLVNKYRKEYRKARRHDKSKIIRSIITETKKSGARFLMRANAKTGNERWVEVDDRKAYEKVSHALRLQRVNESSKIQQTTPDKTNDAPSSSENQAVGVASSLSQAAQHHPSQQVSALAAAFMRPHFPSAPSLNHFHHHQQQPHLSLLSSYASSLPGLMGHGPSTGLMMYEQQLQRQLMLSMLSNQTQTRPGYGDIRPNGSTTVPHTSSSSRIAKYGENDDTKPSAP